MLRLESFMDRAVDILLKTERLILRRLTIADAESVYAIRLEMAKPDNDASQNRSVEVLFVERGF
ncbi:hypothetical protein [Scytonema sp. NUACC26]|uniref:hypothetical protein n=1 Tax=Scytonema sp. NUACC26 TaxID=3140176 RepID=UPI0034DC8F13